MEKVQVNVDIYVFSFSWQIWTKFETLLLGSVKVLICSLFSVREVIEIVKPSFVTFLSYSLWLLRWISWSLILRLTKMLAFLLWYISIVHCSSWIAFLSMAIRSPRFIINTVICVTSVSSQQMVMKQTLSWTSWKQRYCE